MAEGDQMAAALESALPRSLPSGIRTIAEWQAEKLREHGWRLVRSSLVPLPTSNDTTFTEQADYGSDTP